MACCSSSSDRAAPARRTPWTSSAGAASTWRFIDFDEIGVPPGADLAWRRRSNEAWILRALDLQADGRDLLLAAQTPYDELLNSPSAPLLDAVAGCLIDCDDETRLARLRARGPEWVTRTGADLEDYLAWAEWLRHHAADPRWRMSTVDTSGMPVEQVADAVVEWIETERLRAVSFSRRP